jgi:hypothetical protein
LTKDAVAQRDLFEGDLRQRQEAIDQTVDAIRRQHGADAIQRGSLLGRDSNE